MKAFTPLKLKNIELKNRLIRAATYEGMSDIDGIPKNDLKDMYVKLAQNDVGLIIGGFAFTSKKGRAMQPAQSGIDNDKKVHAWKNITDAVHENGGKVFLQISHAGRQTRSSVTNDTVVAPSKVKCTYFKQKPRVLKEKEILEIINEYAEAAFRVKKSGFDGVQVHCAHGYLIHQFLSSYTNRRKDQWGGDYENRFRFAKLIFEKIKTICGDDFPIIVKISSADDRNLKIEDVIEFCKLMEKTGNVDAIEFSYGTMEFAMNIFRGDLPVKLALKYNPLYKDFPEIAKKIWLKTGFLLLKKKFIAFKENYNFNSAKKALNEIKLPIFVTGGIRSKKSIENILDSGVSAVSLCRPFLREPDFAKKIKESAEDYFSKCINCNICTIMCDSGKPTRCYQQKQ